MNLENVSLEKKNVVIGHRKRLNLCLRCGKEKHDADCIETYNKADNRIKIHKEIDIEKKKKTIINYRKKKNLCIRCGKEIHSELNCIENYNKTDNRTEEEKDKRPAIILTPKLNESTIIKQLTETHKEHKKIKIQQTEKIKLQRDFILIDLTNSSKGNIIEPSFIFYICRRYNDMIICTFGKELHKIFSVSDVLKLKKIKNLIEIKDCSDQNIINYICSCKRLFSFPSSYTKYCADNKIHVYIFDCNKNVSSPFSGILPVVL